MDIYRRVIVPSLVTSIAGGILLLSPLGSIVEEGVGLAWLFNLRGSIPAPTAVMVVSIDANSANQLEQPSKLRNWDRSLHADLVRKLADRGAAAVVFDVFFDESGSDAEDNKFAREIRLAKRVILVQQVQRDQVNDITLDRLIFPAPTLAAEALGLAPFPLPKVRNRFGQFSAFYSGISHSSTLPVVALQVLVLRMYGYKNFLNLLRRSGFDRTDDLPLEVTDSKNLRLLMSTLRAELRSAPQLFNNLMNNLNQADDNLSAQPRVVIKALAALAKVYLGSDNYFLNFYGPPASVTTVPYSTFWKSAEIQAEYGLDNLSGKVIFIGGTAQMSMAQSDGFFTVFSGKDGVDIGGVEIAATAFANLLDDRTLRPASALTSLGIVLVFGGLAGFLASRIAGILAFAATLAVGATYLTWAFFLFATRQFWIPVFVPIAIQLPLALFLGYLWQYSSARRAREKYSQTIRYYVPERVAKGFDEGHDPTTTPELVFGTCMSTDVTGYTTLVERISKSEFAILNREYFDLLGTCVAHQNGEMFEVRGDGMNCVWSAPQPEKQLNIRACLAGREILDAVEQFNRSHADSQFPTRVGLHSGWVHLVNVGGGGHLAYSVVGDSMNTASRIQDLNKKLHTQLLASEQVIRDLDDCLVRRICSFQPKGKAEILSIFEVFGPRSMATSGVDELCEMFDAALLTVEAADWSKAENMFEEILSANPTDGPTLFYLERCQRYRTSPPTSGDQTVIRAESGAQ